MDYSIKTEYHKLRYKWRELNKELSSLKEIEETAAKEFHDALMIEVEKFNLNNPFSEKEKKDEKSSEIFEADETKKIYREVAIRSHPDKNKEGEDVFKSLVSSKKNNSLNGLLDSAKEVKLKIKNISIEQIEKIEEEIYDLEKSISKIINSIHWMWYHEDNRSRNLIINNIIINIINEQKKEQSK